MKPIDAWATSLTAALQKVNGKNSFTTEEHSFTDPPGFCKHLLVILNGNKKAYSIQLRKLCSA